MTSPCATRPSDRDVQPSTADRDDRAAYSTRGWWQAAYCRGADTDIFFPLPGDLAGIQRALRICQSCPVQNPCRQYALGRRERYGIWGGQTEETRELIIRGGPPPTLGVPRRPVSHAGPARATALHTGSAEQG
jgi:WhiB family redox-sensing transcriptional regulator